MWTLSTFYQAMWTVSTSILYNSGMTQAKNSYHHGDLRAGLIAETINMIGEGAFSDITMRKLAERLSVSRTAPYRHFESKESLFAAVAEEGFLLMCERIRPIAQNTDIPPKERLIELGTNYFLFAVENSDHYKLMFGDNAINYHDHPNVMAAGYQAFRVLLKVVRDCQAAGVVRDEDAVQLATFFWATGHGYAHLVISGHLPIEQVQPIAYWAAEMIGQGIFKP